MVPHHILGEKIRLPAAPQEHRRPAFTVTL
jgi:hypothetical protein